MARSARIKASKIFRKARRNSSKRRGNLRRLVPVKTQAKKGATSHNVKPPRKDKTQDNTDRLALTKTSKPIPSQLVAAIEKRSVWKRSSKSKPFQLYGKPRMKRGRRPKGMQDYTPMHQEEDAYVLESDYEGFEYDTGIKLKEKEGEEGGLSLDRMDDFDEELNFDF